MKSFTIALLASYLAIASAMPTVNIQRAGPALTFRATTNSTTSASGTNVQKFTGALGGTPPAVIQTTGDRPFSVNGDSFVGIKAALGRSCDVQHNACATAANSGAIDGGVSQCDQQNTECHAANGL